MNITRKVELLAPAGDLECIKAAINAGADAVYTGGDKFGARAFANNLNKDELIEAINYAHIHEAFIYLTVNTLLKDDEIKKDLYDYILPLYEAGLDAVIVQDMGVFKFIKDNFKNLDIHISTQSTINGKRTAKKYKELGASRVVTPRELSLEGIKDISENVDIEIESFIHGALCYCYSGMCLLSSVIGGRSGNRGRCAQPCRKDYVFEEHKSTLLSTKDMCTIKILPEIINSGVYSLKIEGRMKKPTYVAGVVSIYRKYIDYYLSNKDSIDSGKMKYEVKDDDYNNLLDLFNRNGFNESYYKIHCDKSMMSLTKPKFRAENKSLTDYLNKSFIENNKREDLIIDVVIKKDTPIKVKVTALRKYEEYIITEFESITPDLAINRELDANEVEKQLSKLGNT
ncbi:MAG TPA: peptidase U32, partial [Eubacterium sp.]|nr:peptidase U32 [Eubacterium sp.]